MSRSSWLAARVVLAIALMVSFYVLALGLSSGLLWLAYVDLTRAAHPAFRLIAFCVGGAGSVLWAIVPRRDRFEPPGPRVTADEQPALFALIADVAAATSQPLPADVYLTNDVNAFVTQREGMMGIGGRRVMGLGLPLMQALTVDEFKGVLTHEFGHYHAGDVALGPWIYKTQNAMIRTISHLSENVLRFIFIGFAKLFLRVTHAVSRRQEFIADELAASVVGPEAMGAGLRKLGVTALAYQSYWYTEFVPVIKAGFRPPLVEGLHRFAASARVSGVFHALAEQQEASAQASAYDTHPPLGDRLAALQRLPSRPGDDSRPATALLREVEECERRLLAALSTELEDLKPLEWARVSDEVYLPLWRARVDQHGTLLQGFTIGQPPTCSAERQTIGRGIVPNADREDTRDSVAWQLIVAGFVLALMPLGWTAETHPGEEVVLRRGSDELRPYSELVDLGAARITAAQWQARCARLGIGAVPLGAECESSR